MEQTTVTASDHQNVDPEDDELMQRFAANVPDSAAAFDALYARYKDNTWRYFRRQLSDDAARDAQQELWMKLIERKARYKPINRFGGYLFSMASSVLVDTQRKSLRVIDANTVDSEVLDTVAADRTSDPVAATHLQRALSALKSAIGKLPLAQRNTFVLHQESGLSYADIAEATDTNAETVKSRLRYARTKLAEDLQEELRHVEL